MVLFVFVLLVMLIIVGSRDWFFTVRLWTDLMMITLIITMI